MLACSLLACKLALSPLAQHAVLVQGQISMMRCKIACLSCRTSCWTLWTSRVSARQRYDCAALAVGRWQRWPGRVQQRMSVCQTIAFACKQASLSIYWAMRCRKKQCVASARTALSCSIRCITAAGSAPVRPNASNGVQSEDVRSRDAALASCAASREASPPPIDTQHQPAVTIAAGDAAGADPAALPAHADALRDAEQAAEPDHIGHDLQSAAAHAASQAELAIRPTRQQRPAYSAANLVRPGACSAHDAVDTGWPAAPQRDAGSAQAGVPAGSAQHLPGRTATPPAQAGLSPSSLPLPFASPGTQCAGPAAAAHADAFLSDMPALPLPYISTPDRAGVAAAAAAAVAGGGASPARQLPLPAGSLSPIDMDLSDDDDELYRLCAPSRDGCMSVGSACCDLEHSCW